MKKYFVFALALASLCLFSCNNAANVNEHGWYTDYSVCQKKAKSEGKRIILLFSRDDSDTRSAELKKDIFFTDKFNSLLGKDYVFCNLDFSRSVFEKTKLNPELKGKEKIYAKKEASKAKMYLERNMKIASILGIHNSPSVITLTKYGYAAKEFPYFECTTPEEFAELLNDSNEKLTILEDLTTKVEKAKGVQKALAIDELYSAMDDTYSYLLKDLILKVPSLDKKDESGIVGKYVLATASVEAMDCYFARKPEESDKPYVKVASSKYLNPEQKQQAFYAAAYVTGARENTIENVEKSIGYLKDAVAAAPDSPLAAQCKMQIERGEVVVARLKENAEKEKQADAAAAEAAKALEEEEN